MDYHYGLHIRWTGNLGTGTSSYREYSREHEISAVGKQTMICSSDPHFRGDSKLYNPEEFLLSSVSKCHMLWYLHFCADNGIIVERYEDKPTGTMVTDKTGYGKFTEIILHPEIWIKDIEGKEMAINLHEKAHHFCFIANSCNFPILIQPDIKVTSKLA